jgi:hypothetical protein
VNIALYLAVAQPCPGSCRIWGTNPAGKGLMWYWCRVCGAEFWSQDLADGCPDTRKAKGADWRVPPHRRGRGTANWATLESAYVRA